MPNIRLTIAYDGTAYCGWQVQPNGRTVQAEVQTAIRRLTGEDVSIVAAGRTDSGVHALGQVANFVTASSIPAEKWRPALQAKLPPDVVVLNSREVPAEFHATYSAVSKRYRYLIRRSPVDDPFTGRYAWRIGDALEVASMNSAAQDLIGAHDFRCFESHWPNKATSVRTVFQAGFTVMPRWPGWCASPLFPAPAGTDADFAPDAAEFLCFEIEADGFLYNMVRAIVGTLVNVGRGRWPVDCIPPIIAGQDRAAAGETAPPHGLYLVQVRYPGDKA